MMDVMTSTPRPRRTLASLAVAALVAAGLGACTPDESKRNTVAQPSPSAIPVPRLVVGNGHGTTPWDAPLSVSVRQGVLTHVGLVDAEGTPLEGELGATGWTSSTTKQPDTAYRVTATVTDLGGRARVLHATVRTSVATKTLQGTLSPGDGKVVGIGQPVVLRLSRPVTEAGDRAAVEARLSVTTVPAVAGAWRWMSPTELHYRGPTYWTKGTQVTVRADFRKLLMNHWVWGEGLRQTTFQIGSAVVATVDVQKLAMTVVVDGKLVRTVKVSTGRDKYPTKGGVHLVLEKVKVEVMDSATVGIPRDAPDGYYEKVPNSVRISYGGAFVHSASWSVRDQGVRNVSHGCVNLSPADAAWFFTLVKRGDIVNIVNAKAPPLLSDPGMSDWNIPFGSWAN